MVRSSVIGLSEILRQGCQRGNGVTGLGQAGLLLAGQGDLLKFRLQVQCGGIQRAFAQVHLDALGKFLVQGVEVAVVQQITPVMLRLRHTADAANGLYFKRLAHVVPELHQNVGSGAVPAGSHRLFDDNRDLRGVIVVDALQILMLLGQPDRKLSVFVGNSVGLSSFVAVPV